MDQTDWAYALAELTSLDAAKLLNFRAEALSPNRITGSFDLPLPSLASDLEVYIQGIKNKVIPPLDAGVEARQLANE